MGQKSGGASKCKRRKKIKEKLLNETLPKGKRTPYPKGRRASEIMIGRELGKNRYERRRRAVVIRWGKNKASQEA